MKKIFLLLAAIIAVSTNISAQIDATIVKSGYLLSEFNGSSFNKKKKIKANTPLLLIDDFQKMSGFYVVSYKEERYYINGEYLDRNSIATFNKIEKDAFNRAKFVEDSIFAAKEAIKEAERKRVAQTKRIEQARQDSILIVQKAIADSLENDKDLRRGALYIAWAREEKERVSKGFPIEIKSCYITEPNSSGGVDLEFQVKNISENVIKYISLSGYIINAVGDRAYCTIRKYSTTTVKGVGPIENGTLACYSWENLWYNHTADSFHPTQIKIEYMNGKITILNQAKVKTLLDTPYLENVVKEMLKKPEFN